MGTLSPTCRLRGRGAAQSSCKAERWGDGVVGWWSGGAVGIVLRSREDNLGAGAFLMGASSQGHTPWNGNNGREEGQ